ncbi:MAG: MoaD/ThiS family protein [Candidatus Brocadiales bacterium]
MPVIVRVPTPLRPLTDNAEQVEVNGSSIREIIDDLESKHAGIKGRLCDEKGEIRRFINVYLNDEDIRFLKNQDTPVKDGDKISIVPAIAGG